MRKEQLDGLSRDALIALVVEQAAVLTEQAAQLAAAMTKIVELEGELEELRQGGGRGGGPVKTASNSSVPPSKSWKAGRPAPEAGQEAVKRGPPVGHPGVSRERVPLAQVDQVVACRPQRCADCGSSLPETGGGLWGNGR